MPVSVSELPIDALMPQMAAALRGSASLVIEAAPGAGKTTRVPPALLALVCGEVLVLEPRRIAARMAARRCAEELGEPLGETVGYQVRFEEVSGPRTRLRFLTEGVLTRRLLSDPELRGVDAVILDEFHERHLDTDLALALLKRLQVKRPTLKLIVMSATLDAAPVAAFLDGCPVLRSEGRNFPLKIDHLPYSPKPLDLQVAGVVHDLLREGVTGHILVFLPGAAEIRRALRSSESFARAAGAVCFPLHGDLPPDEQDRAVGPSRQQKILFSTNVAESSVTIDGVSAVVDTGLARFASYSPWTGLPTLEVGRISKASAKQRAGRAGRTGPGRALRLYPLEDFAQRPEQDTPALLRSDLSGLCLALRAMHVDHFKELRWLDAPPEQAVAQAEALLDRLGAVGARAIELARYPLPPRLACMLQEAVLLRVPESGIAAAALLGSGMRIEGTDLLSALDLPPDAKALQSRRQLRRLLRGATEVEPNDQALLQALLAGFPDRVARLRAGNQLLLSSGNTAELAGERPAHEFLVVLDAEDRKDKQLPIVRMTARVEPEWLFDLFPEHVTEEARLEWHRSGERVEAVSVLRYDELPLAESRTVPSDEVAVAAMLAEQALSVGIERFVDGDALQNLLERVRFAGLPEPDLTGELQTLCFGLRSFAELRGVAGGFLAQIENGLGALLRERAPATLRLPTGRVTMVHYEAGKPPWIASRLQDFFGMRETPCVGRDRMPVVVHLLTPNQRAVQTTTDLHGFWERLYPQVRRELMRRYPRHQWPERP